LYVILAERFQFSSFLFAVFGSGAGADSALRIPR
jgi:hypothetical protein